MATLLSRVFFDLVGPLQNDTMSYDEDNRYILTIMDDCSRFLRAVAIPNINQDTVTTAFKDNWTAVFGYPQITGW